MMGVTCSNVLVSKYIGEEYLPIVFETCLCLEMTYPKDTTRLSKLIYRTPELYSFDSASGSHCTPL